MAPTSRFSSARTMRVARDLLRGGPHHLHAGPTRPRCPSRLSTPPARRPAAPLRRRLRPGRPPPVPEKGEKHQEAHEAIRPAGDSFRTPEQTGLSGDARRLYELVWMRTVASQMADPVGKSVQVRFGATRPTDAGPTPNSAPPAPHHLPRLPAGVRRGQRRPRREREARDVRLPTLTVGDAVTVWALDAERHSTPPGPLAEASLIKTLEDLGVGRPST